MYLYNAVLVFFFYLLGNTLYVKGSAHKVVVIPGYPNSKSDPKGMSTLTDKLRNACQKTKEKLKWGISSTTCKK